MHSLRLKLHRFFWTLTAHYDIIPAMRKFAVIHARLLLLAALNLAASSAPAEDAAEQLSAPGRLPSGVSACLGKLKNPGLKLALSSDGTLLAALDATGQIALFDTVKNKKLLEFETGGACAGLEFGPHNQQLFTAGPGADIGIWKVGVGKLERKLEGGGGELCAIAISPDGARVASTDRSGLLRIWNLSSGEKLFELKAKQEKEDREANYAEGLDWSPDGRFIVTEATDIKARVWDAVRGVELLTVRDHDGNTAALAIAPGGVLCASTRAGGVVRLWRMDSGEIVHSFTGHADFVTSLAFAPDGTTLLTGSLDRTVRQWDVESGIELRRFALPAVPLSLIAAPDGVSFFTLSDDSKILKWSLSGAPDAAEPERPLPPLDEAWSLLGSQDYDKRSAGAWIYLLSNPDAAVRHLAARIGAERQAAPGEGGALIAQLDDPNYAVRERAFQALQELKSRARAALTEAVRPPHSSEVRRQAAVLLRGMGLPGDGRGNLSLELLGIMHTPAARDTLRTLAAQEGAPAPRARTVLARMWSK